VFIRSIRVIRVPILKKSQLILIFALMIASPENIRKALEQNLPGADSHQKLLPPYRDLDAPEEEKKIAKKSSVLLLLFEENKDLKACLIKRPKHMKFHAGQIALPGGQIEKGETALQTALRETEEEIGITSEKIEILGSLSELYVSVSGFLIHPFVGWLKTKPKFAINKNEVEKTVLFPVSKYRNTFDQMELNTVTGKLKVPCIKFEDEILWGATAMILAEFYDVLKKLS
jgi:8-oxo-dGTP pyrophosphatase MutT (NUDIX family)